MPSRLTFGRDSGFTIIELISVVVILGIVTAAAIPLMSSKSVFDERFFYDDLLQALRFSQRLSVASGCSVQLSMSGTAFSLLQDSSCNSASPSFDKTVYLPGSADAYQNSDLPSGTSYSSTVSPIVFNSLGQAKNSGGNVFSQAAIVLGSRIILVDGETGFAR
ncbi:MAG: prepilin-type N-terminal cleavage/methylation domain-containing protein [Pseudomonadales bacterium]|nr:prepilin-type N-terminal cleavage/methylation domain-containing protein [Pseudomonadales bacterium]